MPGLSLAPVNFGAIAPNPLAQIGQALGQFPNLEAQSQLQKQQIGQQMLKPYLAMLRSNQDLENNPRFMSTINAIAKQYGIPIPTTTEGGDESGAAQPSQAPSIPAAGTTPGATTTAAAPQTPPTPAQASSMQGQTMRFGVPEIPNPAAPGTTTPSEGMEQKLITDKGNAPGWTTNAAGQTVAATSGAPIPGAPTTTPAQTTATEATGTAPMRTRIDPGFISAIDPQTVLTLQQMQPDQREAYLKATGTDPRWVPKSLLTAPVVMDPAQKVKVLDSINADITKLQNAGNLTPARLQELAHSYESSGLIDPATANSLLEDPDTLSQMGRGMQVKLQLLLQSGQLRQDQYNLAVQRLNAYMSGQTSLADYRKFQEQFIGFHENFMTAQQQQNQERIGLEIDRMSRESEHWDQLLEQGNDRLAHSDYATLAQDTRSAEANYNSLQAQAAQIKSGNPNADLTTATGPPGPDGKPTGESFAQTLANAKALKEKLEQQLGAANQGYRNPTPALNKLGVQTKNTGKVTINGQQYSVGEIVQDDKGNKYKVLQDGKLLPQP